MLKHFFKNKLTLTGPFSFLIVGLGNPGRQYESTRHNVGFMAVDSLAEKYCAPLTRIKFKGLCGEAAVAGQKVLLLKPSTYMNLSGQSVSEAMRYYKLPAERVLLLFDDVSLPPGKIRVRRKGSDGGHNGMKNIIYLTDSNLFPRIKIGIGEKPAAGWDLKDWVLSRFSESEKKELQDALAHAVHAAELILSGDIDQAMNLYNNKADRSPL